MVGTQGPPTPTTPPPPRAAKQRRKGDRLVIACQERTYWLVNRPPVSPSCGEGVVCVPQTHIRSCRKDVPFGVSAGDRRF